MITNENVELRVVLGIATDQVKAIDANKLFLEVAATIQETLQKAYPTTVHVVEIVPWPGHVDEF